MLRGCLIVAVVYDAVIASAVTVDVSSLGDTQPNNHLTYADIEASSEQAGAKVAAAARAQGISEAQVAAIAALAKSDARSSLQRKAHAWPVPGVEAPTAERICSSKSYTESECRFIGCCDYVAGKCASKLENKSAKCPTFQAYEMLVGGEAICEGHSWNENECAWMGCCAYSNGQCKAAEGSKTVCLSSVKIPANMPPIDIKMDQWRACLASPPPPGGSAMTPAPPPGGSATTPAPPPWGSATNPSPLSGGSASNPPPGGSATNPSPLSGRSATNPAPPPGGSATNPSPPALPTWTPADKPNAPAALRSMDVVDRSSSSSQDVQAAGKKAGEDAAALLKTPEEQVLAAGQAAKNAAANQGLSLKQQAQEAAKAAGQHAGRSALATGMALPQAKQIAAIAARKVAVDNGLTPQEQQQAANTIAEVLTAPVQESSMLLNKAGIAVPPTAASTDPKDAPCEPCAKRPKSGQLPVFTLTPVASHLNLDSLLQEREVDVGEEDDHDKSK